MKLKNFDVSSSIELQSGGLFWDLHNIANFDGMELIPRENAAVMRWSVATPTTNPWGCYENKFAGMELYFKKLIFLQIGPRDDELPMSEDRCVSTILKVDPNVQQDDPQMRQLLEPSDSFRLLFQFQSARMFEIDSDSVELVPLTEINGRLKRAQ